MAVSKRFYTIIIYIGYIFFGGGFLTAFGQFIIYNGFGETFEYVPASNCKVARNIERMPCQLLYEYQDINGNEYKGVQNVSDKIAQEIDLESVDILYNKLFPFFSMVKGIEGRSSKSWDFTVGMIVMGFIFLLLFILNTLGNVDKWIKRYEKIGNS
jgi:hypothetical protein